VAHLSAGLAGKFCQELAALAGSTVSNGHFGRRGGLAHSCWLWPPASLELNISSAPQVALSARDYLTNKDDNTTINELCAPFEVEQFSTPR
jgi:hypothetical protein